MVRRGDDGVEIAVSCADMPSPLAAVDADPPDVVLTDIRMPPEGDDAGI
jgi:YesN/AraC family two-component response regulator